LNLLDFLHATITQLIDQLELCVNLGGQSHSCDEQFSIVHWPDLRGALLPAFLRA
jgi:hypothetical protein